jgi:hypothetical protein
MSFKAQHFIAFGRHANTAPPRLLEAGNCER